MLCFFQQTFRSLAWNPRSLVMTLGGFSALLFVPPAPEVLAEIQTAIIHCFLPPHSSFRTFTQFHLKQGLL